VHTTTIRTLKHEYRVATASPELAARLALIETSPEIVGVRLNCIDLIAVTASTGYCLELPDGSAYEGDADTVVGGLAKLVLFGVADEALGAPIIHGASVWRHGKRAVVLALKGTGKTTLALHLLANGIMVEGDEHVVIRECDVIARPRRLAVKQGSLAWLPNWAERIRQCPSITVEEQRVYTVDPSIFGRPWQIRAGKVDHLVFAEPNHGGDSLLMPMAREEAFRRLVEDTYMPEVAQGAAIARLRRLAVEATCWRLRLGSLRQAESYICNLMRL
jgi:hypothetical protein